MADIALKGLVKAFEQDKNILNGLNFEVFEGERVGLLGKNGAGKTTVFRLIAGEIEPDEGTVYVAPGKRVGLISQIPVYPPDYTTEDVLRTAHARLDRISARMKELEKEMAEGPADDKLLAEYDSLLARFEAYGGYDADTDINKVAAGLEISENMRAQLFMSLSGGEKTRVNLARLILEKTDILLLDEPTNHLDFRATEWLEEYLLRFKGTVLIISHDRFFLDRTVGRVIEIVDGRAEFYSGNYSFYVVEKQRRIEEQLKKYEQEQKEIKRLTEAADRLQQWGTGNERLMKKSFAIRSRIERMEKAERPRIERRLKARFEAREFHGDEVLVIKGLSKSYGDRELFTGVELLMQGGERIALIGDNGTGKTTFLKLIMGEEVPDKGYIKKGPSVKMAYLPQVVRFKNPSLSALDTLIFEDNLTPQEARNRLAAFKFTGEDVFKPVSVLSGGEQSRLRLCSLMRNEINLLILDEPTNHLDIQSREWIEEALEEYKGALLFVSHDRYFINRFATRIWELREGRISDFAGTFEEYKQYKANLARFEEIKRQAQQKKEEKPKRKRPQDVGKLLLKLEREIEKLEERLKLYEAEAEKYSTDYEKLLEIDEARAEAEAELDALYEQWGEISG
ncbi:MAG TPA: ABC-F family ATP-binding cassette domain-containing protein [Clostridiales bacterium]|nr:ABC-F family ATP-binding cassette domain-containing protein [Clostridiales bacterium]